MRDKRAEGDGLVGREHRLDNLVAERADRFEEKPSRHAVRDGHGSVRRMVFLRNRRIRERLYPREKKGPLPLGIRCAFRCAGRIDGLGRRKDRDGLQMVHRGQGVRTVGIRHGGGTHIRGRFPVQQGREPRNDA